MDLHVLLHIANATIVFTFFIYGCLGPWNDIFPLEINYLNEC